MTALYFNISESRYDGYSKWTATNISCFSTWLSVLWRLWHKICLLEDRHWLKTWGELPRPYSCVPGAWVHSFTTRGKIPDPTFVDIWRRLIWNFCAIIQHIRQIPQDDAAVSWCRHTQQARLEIRPEAFPISILIHIALLQSGREEF
jgi:hypothetical protein